MTNETTTPKEREVAEKVAAKLAYEQQVWASPANTDTKGSFIVADACDYIFKIKYDDRIKNENKHYHGYYLIIEEYESFEWVTRFDGSVAQGDINLIDNKYLDNLFEEYAAEEAESVFEDDED